MKSVLGMENPLVPPRPDYQGNFFEDVKIALIGVGLISDECGGMPTLEKGTHSKLLTTSLDGAFPFKN